jgi:hypothetical protein
MNAHPSAMHYISGRFLNEAQGIHETPESELVVVW